MSRLEEVKEQVEELSEDRMREEEPHLARAWDDARRSQRNVQEGQRYDKQTNRHTGLDKEQGRERELGEE